MFCHTVHVDCLSTHVHQQLQALIIEDLSSQLFCRGMHLCGCGGVLAG